jgi:hypothetical protein
MSITDMIVILKKKFPLLYNTVCKNRLIEFKGRAIFNFSISVLGFVS